MLSVSKFIWVQQGINTVVLLCKRTQLQWHIVSSVLIVTHSHTKTHAMHKGEQIIILTSPLLSYTFKTAKHWWSAHSHNQASHPKTTTIEISALKQR